MFQLFLLLTRLRNHLLYPYFTPSRTSTSTSGGYRSIFIPKRIRDFRKQPAYKSDPDVIA